MECFEKIAIWICLSRFEFVDVCVTTLSCQSGCVWKHVFGSRQRKAQVTSCNEKVLKVTLSTSFVCGRKTRLSSFETEIFLVIRVLQIFRSHRRPGL